MLFKKIIVNILCIVLISSNFAVEVFAETEHKHCECVTDTCGNNHQSNQQWQEINSLSGLLSASGGYYYLANNIDLGYNTWDICYEKDIHLCLNGKTITADKYTDGYAISVSGKLTITDCKSNSGTIDGNNASGFVEVNGSYGEGVLNIYKGNFIHGRQRKHFFHSVSGAINVYDGVFSNTNSPISSSGQKCTYGFFVSNGANSKININGGEFNAKYVNHNNSDFYPYLFNAGNGGAISISGGCFDATYYGYSQYSFSTASVTGGVFAKESTSGQYEGNYIISLSGIVADGYEVVKNKDDNTKDNYPYRIQKIENFEVNGEKYDTLDKAYKNAKSGETIKVLKNSIIKNQIEFNENKNVTLDLNGYELEGKTNSKYTFNIEKGKLKITDSTNSKSGKLYSHNYSPTLIGVNSGELEIDSGNYSIQIDSYKSYCHVINSNSGKVTLKGGYYSVLEGYKSEENIYSSIVAATQINSNQKSIINITGGTYNASSSGNFASRIFTPYKGDNYDYGTINISGGSFNGNYNNPELTEDENLTESQKKSYLKITGGSYNTDSFSGNVKLKDLIDETNYKVNQNGKRYEVVEITKYHPYIIVNTGVSLKNKA